MKRFHPPLVIFAIVSCLYLGGVFSPLGYGLTDLAFRLLPRPASENIVVVEIDARSLQRLNGWPWPRRYHAIVVNRLIAAGARQVAIDIDFSAPTNPADDAQLSDAIAKADGRIVLPVFKRRPAGSERGSDTIYAVPYAPFAANATLGSVNVRFDGDNNVRRYPTADTWKTGVVPSMASVLATGDPGRRGSFVLDYSIQPDTIPRLSYVDVVTGNFGNHSVAGKTVMIGATEPALGDQLAVPVFGVLPGPVVQAMAYESLTQGRALYDTGPLPALALALLVVLLTGGLYDRVSRRTGMAIMTGTIISGAVTPMVILAISPILLSTVPAILVAMLSYLWSIRQSIGHHVLPIFQQPAASLRHHAILRSAVEDSDDGIVIANGNGIIEFINPTAAVLFGLEREDAPGRPLRDLKSWSPEMDLLLSAETRNPGCLARNRTRPTRINANCPSLGRRSLDLTVNASWLPPAQSAEPQDRQRDVVFIFTFRDITERDATENIPSRTGEMAMAPIT